MTDREEILNTLYPIHKLLNISNKRKNLSCPNKRRHKNSDKHSSAHVYENTIWCFTCKRFYSVSDIIKFNGYNTNELFLELEKKYGDNLASEYDKNKVKVEKEEKPVEKIQNESFINFTKRFFEGNK